MDPPNQQNMNNNTATLEEEKFRKEMVNSFQDLQRAQKAQQAELVEVKDRLEKAIEEKAKLVQELKSRDVTLDTMAKQMAKIQDECKIATERSGQQAKELERFMAMLTSEKAQVVKERVENEKLTKLNNVLKEQFTKATRLFTNMKVRYTEIENTNNILRNSYIRQQREFSELRSQWLRDRQEQKRRDGSEKETGNAKRLAEALAMAQTEITSLQQMLASKTAQVDRINEIEAWINREHQEIQKLNETSREIKDVLSRRVNAEETVVDDPPNPSNGGADEQNGNTDEDMEADKELEELTQKVKESEKTLMEIMEKNSQSAAGGDEPPSMPQSAPRPTAPIPFFDSPVARPKQVEPKRADSMPTDFRRFEPRPVEPKPVEKKRTEAVAPAPAMSFDIHDSPRGFRFTAEEMARQVAQNRTEAKQVEPKPMRMETEDTPRPSFHTFATGNASSSGISGQERPQQVEPKKLDQPKPTSSVAVVNRNPAPVVQQSQGAPFLPSLPSWLGF